MCQITTDMWQILFLIAETMIIIFHFYKNTNKSLKSLKILMSDIYNCYGNSVKEGSDSCGNVVHIALTDMTDSC
jgi:hypothetical protein